MKFKYFPWLIGLLLLVVIVLASFPAPAIIQVDSGEGQNKVTFNAPFTLHFSQIMDRDSIEDAFQLTPETKGVFKWKDFKTLEFYPEKDLIIGDHYRIVIKGEARSLWMKKLNYDAAIDYLVTGPPYVIFADPPETSVLKKNGTITVMFDRPMDWNGMERKDLIQSDPALEGDIRFMGMSAFRFTPKKILAGKKYSFTVPAGLMGLDGGLTEEAFSWSVPTPSLSVEENSPVNDSKKVALNEPIHIRFNGKVSLAGIKPGINALLYPSNDLDADKEQKMDGFFNTEVTYGLNEAGEAETDTLVFTPSFDYQPDEDYRFVLKADADLHLEEDFELTFKTLELTEEGAEEDAEALVESDTAEEGSTEGGPAWEKNGMEFFIRGENPRLELTEPLSHPATLSACQVSSSEFMRLSAEKGWNGYKCETESVTINPVQKNDGKTLNLNDYFHFDWVTGVYFASLSEGDRKITKLFLVEDSTLLLKRSDNDLFVWALDSKSGDPIADMELEILDYHGNEITTGITDETGVFVVDQSFDEGIYVRGKKEGDLTRWALASDQWLLDSASSSVNSESYPELFIVLNQKKFIPGDTMRVKGIWRSQEKHVLSFPDSTQVTITIEDSRGNFILSKRAPLRRNGSFDSSVELPEDSIAGDYFVVVSDLNHQQLSDSIPIRIDDSGADIALEWVEAKDDFATGSIPVFIAKARYKNGIPAAGLTGHFDLYQRPFSLDYENGSILYSFGLPQADCTGQCKDLPLLYSEDFEFSLNGEAKLLLTNGQEGFLKDGYQYYLQVTTTLPNQKSATLHHSFKVHQGSYDLGLGLKHALVGINEAIEASFVTMSYDGSISSGNKVRVSLLGSKGSSREYFSETFESGLQPAHFSISIPPELEDGIYLLHAESQDDKRNILKVELPVYISTNPLLPMDDHLLLASDQGKYFVGGRAHLLINEPSASEDHPVPVVVTYERAGGLLAYEALNLSDPVTQVAVPIKESMQPYFIAKVTRFNRGLTPSFDHSSQRIDVGRDDSVIFVDLNYEKNELKPGEELTVDISTYDYQNRPLSAVITLNVLDLPPDSVGLSYDSFFPPSASPLAATSNIGLLDLSYSPIFDSLAENHLIPPGRSVYFDPLITTDESGKASVSFKLPEERHDLFMQAYATKNTQQFGSTDARLKMNQQLLINPILPSFVTPGDQTIFGASVKNVSDAPLQSRLKLISPNASTKGDSSRNFSLQPGQQTEIFFSVFVDPSLVQDSIQVLFESDQDSFETSLPLKHMKLTSKIPGGGLMEDFWTGRISLPKNAYQGLDTLRLLMSGSPLAAAKIQSELLDFTRYESTYSSAARLLSKLIRMPRASEEATQINETSESDRISTRGLLSSLLGRADPTGGYHFWNEPQFSPLLSATVLFTYAEAIDRGFELDQDSVSQTLELLWASLENSREIALDDRLFILWILGKNEQYDTEKTLEYFQQREDLSPAGKAFLLMNLKQLIEAGQKSASPLFETLKAELTDAIIQEDMKASLNSSVESTAITLYTLNELDPENPLLEPLANYVASYSDLNVSPHEALWICLSLQNFLSHQTGSNPNFIAQLKLNGTLVMDQSVTAKTVNDIYDTSLKAGSLSSEGINDLFLKKEGLGSLYFDAYLTSFLNPSQIPHQEKGIILLRQFYEPNREGALLPVDVFRKGHKYISKLELIVPRDYSYVVLTDEFPEGVRISSKLPKEYPFSQHLSEKNKIVYFASDLQAGVYELDTQIQALVPGSYALFPAMVSPLFEPAVLSRTKGEMMQIID